MRTRQKAPLSRRKLRFEALEGRRMLVYSGQFAGGELTITADGDNDLITVTIDGSGLFLVNSLYPTYPEGEGFASLESVSVIRIFAGDGSDGWAQPYFVTMPVIFDGGSGHDSLYLGTEGSFSVTANQAGNVSFSSVEHISVAGNDDANTITNTGFGGRVAFLGYGGDDTLRGGSGNDQLYGGEGVDHIYGGAGEDDIYGGSGNDKLYGGDDLDHLFGGEDNDFLDGEGGTDYLQGEGGDDRIIDISGQSLAYGGPGNDYLEGGPENDLLFGEEDDDELAGNAGNDSLDGGNGEDKLYGGPGGDRLVPQADEFEMSFGPGGKDEVHGGAGLDTVYVAADTDYLWTTGALQVGDWTIEFPDQDAGQDIEHADFTAGAGNNQFGLADQNLDITITAGAGTDRVEYLAKEPDVVVTGTSTLSVLSIGETKFSSVITFEPIEEFVLSCDLTATVEVSDFEGSMTIIGGSGGFGPPNHLIYRARNSEDLTFNGRLLSNGANTNLTLDNFEWSDLYGDAGDNDFDIDLPAQSLTSVHTIDGGGGDDKLTFRSDGDLSIDTGDLGTIVRGKGNLIVSAVDQATLVGRGGPNRFTLTDSDDVFPGGLTLDGGGGIDTLDYRLKALNTSGEQITATNTVLHSTGRRSDVQLSGIENLKLTGTNLADSIDAHFFTLGTVEAHGLDGNDEIRGGSKNDLLFGDGGIDRLFGLEGNDVLEGGLGVDHGDGGLNFDTGRQLETEISIENSDLPARRSDVDGNGAVDSQDVLWVIYYYRLSTNGIPPEDAEDLNLDLNGDGLVDPADVLLAITDFIAGSTESEGASAINIEGESHDLEALRFLIAEDLVGSRKKK